jgi:hypothetical protein
MRAPIRIISLLLAVSTGIFAQSDRGTVTGTISDPGGSVVAGAQIEAKNLSTGLTYQSASTGTGNYTVTELPVGQYEIDAAVPALRNMFGRAWSCRRRRHTASTSLSKWARRPSL